MSVLVEYTTRGLTEVLVVGVWTGVVLAAALLVRSFVSPHVRLRRQVRELRADNARLREAKAGWMRDVLAVQAEKQELQAQVDQLTVARRTPR